MFRKAQWFSEPSTRPRSHAAYSFRSPFSALARGADVLVDVLARAQVCPIPDKVNRLTATRQREPPPPAEPQCRGPGVERGGIVVL
jgi:hypothetical protein